MSKEALNNNASLIWSVAELLRGDLKQSEYQKVVLPFTVLRRLDAVLAPKKAEFLEKAATVADHEGSEVALAAFARATYGHSFYNTSPLDFAKLTDDADNVAGNLRSYIAKFSPDVRDVIERFRFDDTIGTLERMGLLYKVVGKFAQADLHPDTVTNIEMGYLYEELIRKFSELSNETAGEHFTPREVIELMVNLLITDEAEVLSVPGKIVRIYDPAAGTGGMLSVAEDHIREYNPEAKVAVAGQELNDETYAIAKSDMMVKGQDPKGIVPGNSFIEDGHKNETFDYMLANPPFGVDWGKYAEPIQDEHNQLGFEGRFGPGLPRKSDGSMLFLLHMISKMKPVEEGGSRIAIIFNASPLFTGAAGGGESEIRRWIIENDWLEAIVAMPEQMFYNTGIATYVWVVTNNKAAEREGVIQLIDAREKWAPMKKSLGDKRRYFTKDHIAEITRLHGDFGEADEYQSKLFPNHHFGFQKITVERPKRRRFELTDEALAELRAVKLPKAWSEGDIESLMGSLDAALFPTTDPNEAKKAVEEATSRTPKLSPALARRFVEALGVVDENAEPILNKTGNPEPDTKLRDNELVPLPKENYPWESDPTDRLADEDHRQAVNEYLEEEVLPWIPDAWVDHSKTKIGYEIPFTREFYVYQPPRPLEEIDADIEGLESEILALLEEIKR